MLKAETDVEMLWDVKRLKNGGSIDEGPEVDDHVEELRRN